MLVFIMHMARPIWSAFMALLWEVELPLRHQKTRVQIQSSELIFLFVVCNRQI